MIKFRNKVLLVLGLSSAFLFSVGCTDLNKLQKQVSEGNKRTDTLLKGYIENKEAAKLVEEGVINGFIIGELDNNTMNYLKGLNRMYLLEDIQMIHIEIKDYIEIYNIQMERQEMQGIEDISSFVKGLVEIHYFMDTESNITEQTFIFKLPNGRNTIMSLKWAGGVCVDFETIRNY